MVNFKAGLKKWFAVVISCVLIAAIFGEIRGAAYFTDAQKAENVLTVGENTIEIVEEFDPPEELIPGVSFTKDVNVKNIGTAKCYVRIKALFSNSHMEQLCLVDWNETDWIYNPTDGYWYYPKELSQNTSTPSLFTTVKIKDDTPEDQIIDFDIIVYAESVEAHQGKGFSTYTEAWTHYQKNKS